MKSHSGQAEHVDTDLSAQARALPWWARLLLIRPATVAAHLALVHRAEIVERPPNMWQIVLGVLRMWSRVLFRFNTIGTCAAHPVRPTWRARILRWRPARFVPLLLEGAVSPWDMTGLLSSHERMMRHLLGAHHDGDQFVYDLQILSCHPGALRALLERAQNVVDRDDRRGRWLRDLCVYAHYHEALVASTRKALAGDFSIAPTDVGNPDITFDAWLRWCARQPETPQLTWQARREGRFSFL